jgi:hypothetical protein
MLRRGISSTRVLTNRTSQSISEAMIIPSPVVWHGLWFSLRKEGPRLSGFMPPDELRSQLPWSYLGPRNVPMKPKSKQASVVEEELERPPVPAPDYTLHFGKTNRPSTSNWSEDGASPVTSASANHRGPPAPSVDRSNSCKRSTSSQILCQRWSCSMMSGNIEIGLLFYLQIWESTTASDEKYVINSAKLYNTACSPSNSLSFFKS